MPGEPRSPLCDGDAVVVRSLSRDDLIEAYRDEVGFDISEFLPPRATIDLCRCEKTGLEFFHPLNELAGSPEFYEGFIPRPALFGAIRNRNGNSRRSPACSSALTPSSMSAAAPDTSSIR